MFESMLFRSEGRMTILMVVKKGGTRALPGYLYSFTAPATMPSKMYFLKKI